MGTEGPVGVHQRGAVAAPLGVADQAEQQAVIARLDVVVQLAHGPAGGDRKPGQAVVGPPAHVTVRPGPGGGLFAAEPSPMVRLGNSVLALDAEQTSVADAVRIRDALDPLMIEDALWHASPAALAQMRAQVQRMNDAVGAQDPIAFIRANW